MRVERVVSVNRPMGTVVDYLRDFSHTQSWDPGTVVCVRDDSGPIRKGARWHNVSQFMGRTVELDYRLERDDPAHLTFTGRGDKASTIDDLVFHPDGDHTWITYRAEIRLHGPARAASLFIIPAVNRLADDVAIKLPAVIDTL